MQKICGSVLKVSEKVAQAIAHNKAVVALQSTIISHGMPYPQNKQCALRIENIIQQKGAVPATIAIFDGIIHVGLDQSMIEKLATIGPEAKKISRRDLPFITANKGIGSTTVSATMIGAHAAGINLFVTGGIGGVHRGFEKTMDVSADLEELGRTPVAVISAGVKSILDIPKTLEYLETKGVPVMTYKSQNFPAFFSASSGIKSPYSIQSIDEAAQIIYNHHKLGLENGLLIAVPNNQPAEGQFIQKCIQKALKQAEQQNIQGAKITPFLLQRVNQLTEGKSLQSNMSLIYNNANIGAEIALKFAQIKRERISRAKALFSFEKKYDNIGEKMGKLISIGGSALDYQIVPKNDTKFQLYKSCPGYSRKTLGGVARNIAQSARRLGVQTNLVTALGKDEDAKIIKKNSKDLGIELFSVTPSIVNCPSARYLAIMDESNNQLLGISQMQVNSNLTLKNLKVKYFSKMGESISPWDIFVLDNNLQAQISRVASFIAKSFNCFTIFQAKGKKTSWVVRSGALKHLHMLKMNKLQKQELFGAIREKYPKVQDVNKWLMKEIGSNREPSPYTNIKMIVTDGPNQVQIVRSLGEQYETSQIKVHKVSKVAKTTGSGDTMTGVFVSMLLQGSTDVEALKYSIAASRFNIQHDVEESTISSFLSKQSIERIMQEQFL